MEFKNIPNYEKYKINRNGDILGRYNRLMKPGRNKCGYLQLSLCKNRKKKTYFVHRLVLLTFVGECPEGKECDHINRIRDDNRLENLRWVSKSENQFNRIVPFKIITNGGISKHGGSWQWKYRHNNKYKTKTMKNKEELLKYTRGGN